MAEDKMLSVIVPVYNVAPYLDRCVSSLLAQDYPDLEILLVDDGSQDGSGALCDGYAKGDARVRVLHKENGGLSSARNAGLDRARGTYVTFVDSDDYVEPGAYAPMIALLEQYGAVVVCGGRFDVDGETGHKTVGLCPPRTEKVSAEEAVGRLFLWDGCDSSVCDKVFHRCLFATRRFPEGKICEDVSVTYRILLEAGTVILWERPYYNYVHRSGSITTAAVSDSSFHLCQHTAEIYTYIREFHPAIAPQARFFRVRSLSHILLRLDGADEKTRSRYAGAYREARSALSKHVFFFLTSPFFDRREKLRDMLLVLGLYRWLRPRRRTD